MNCHKVLIVSTPALTDSQSKPEILWQPVYMIQLVMKQGS